MLLDAILVGWLIVTAGGFYITFTHKVPPFLPRITHFSYGMLAPYQNDDDINVEPVVVAWEASGATTLLPIEGYFPGVRGERNSRMRLEQVAGQDPQIMARNYETILTQILLHERAAGRAFARLDLIWEEWPKSPLGYDALRMHSTRDFITQVQ